jgi:asparagine synthase (glutamine-hydrolysing)
LEEPVCEDLIYPYSKVSRLAKETASVVLTGEGADEFLHGYRYYQFLHNYGGIFKKIPKTIRNWIYSLLMRKDLVENAKLRILAALLRNTTAEMAIQWSTMIPSWEMRELLCEPPSFSIQDLFSNAVAECTDEKMIPSFLDHKYRLVDYILMRTDKMSMQVALETRSPFLDYRVVEYMVRLPIQYKNYDGMNKILLRRAYKGFLPSQIIDRRKKPFAAPINTWLYNLSMRYFSNSSLVKDSIITQRGLSRYLIFDKDNKAIHSKKLLSLLILEIWYRTFFQNEREHFN